MREICQRRQPLILDEVMPGVGRRPLSPGAGSHYGDLICITKGLGAGYHPISRRHGIRPDIHDTIRAGTGFFPRRHAARPRHGLRRRPGLQRQIEERDLMTNVRAMALVTSGCSSVSMAMRT